VSEPQPVLLMANFADRIGGGEESLLGLVRGLDRARFAPHVHVPGEGGMALELRRIGVPIAVRSLPTVRPWTLLAGGRAVRDLRALLSARRIRLVHAHGSRSALYAGLAARRSRIPVIWHVRIVDRDPWLDGLLLRMSSAVVANSAAAAGRFRGRSRATTKVRVVPNGVDLERFSPGAAAGLAKTLAAPAEGPVVVYIGRLERGKGPDLFLEAARVTQRTLPQARFVLVGDGPMRATLEADARAADVRATFVGYQADPRPFLGMAAAVVVPSRQEAFGRVLIEAMAAEVPVVATRVGGIPEVCVDGRTGLLVPPEDPGALARAIVSTLTDPDATRARVRAAVAEVRLRFTLATHVERIQQLYDAVLAPGGVDGVPR
jgi:glycosyltransferase involved in cell wall biosynthesis